MRRILLFSLIMFPTMLAAQSAREWYPLIGSAYADNASHTFLRRLCDETGGRLTGSPENWRALDILKEEMAKHGCEVQYERFRFPGFVRGNDEVVMTVPLRRVLRAVALGYVDSTPQFDAPVVFVQQGYEEQFTGVDVKGTIVLATSEHAQGKPELLRSEVIATAAKHGAKGVLFIREAPGGITMVGMTNFHGAVSPLPAFTITWEEGKWLQRLCESGGPVRVSIAVKSACRELETANAVVRFPGASRRKIVLGAHFDGWDVGQGAVDNGVGTAVLFDVARIISTFFPRNPLTIECVWFNGEEIGLWGSKRYMQDHMQDSIIAMINMDMTGSPTGFNAMGTDTLIPFLKDIATRLNGFTLSPDIGSGAWTNSDHEPFMLQGIPTIGIHAKLEPDMVRHYHDLGDSFDKVSKRYLCDAAAVVSVLTRELANTASLNLRRRTKEETIAFLRKHGLEEKLRKQKEWIFD